MVLARVVEEININGKTDKDNNNICEPVTPGLGETRSRPGHGLTCRSVGAHFLFAPHIRYSIRC